MSIDALSPRSGGSTGSFTALKQKLGFLWRLLRETILIYTRIGGEQSAAAFAYYALFSLVPLVALLVSLGTYIFPSEQVPETIHRFMPIGAAQQELLWSMVNGLEKARGGVGIASVAILTWASLRFFHTLVLSINHAWGTRHIPWWQMPIKNLLMIISMSGALIVGTIVPALLQAIARTLHSLESWINDFFPLFDVRRVLTVVDVSRYVGGTFVLFYSFSVLYILAPRHRTNFSQIWIPSLLVSVLMQVGQACFVNIVPKLINYSAIYGPMGGMMFLLLWVYVAGVIIISGGCLCAALAHQTGHHSVHSIPQKELSQEVIEPLPAADHPTP